MEKKEIEEKILELYSQLEQYTTAKESSYRSNSQTKEQVKYVFSKLIDMFTMHPANFLQAEKTLQQQAKLPTTLPDVGPEYQCNVSHILFALGTAFRSCGGVHNFEISETCFTYCIEQNEQTRSSPVLYNERGFTRYLQVAFNLAFEDFSKAIELSNSQFWPAFQGRGIIAYRMSKWSQSEQDFKTVLTFKPNLPDAIAYLKLVEKGKSLRPEYDAIDLYYI